MADLRQRDAAKARRLLADAVSALKAAENALLLWSDSVRADAEKIHGADAPDEVIWKVPDYANSLDAVREIQAAGDRLTGASKAFGLVEDEGEDTK
jgi:hypothetical protein